MSNRKPSFFARIGIAFRVLFSAELGLGVRQLIEQGSAPALPEPEPEPQPEPEPEPPPVVAARPDAALQLLGLLQREGRFIDFLQEDVSAFSDDEIGAAARVVHEGCKKAVDEHFEIEPVRDDEEGASVELPKGYDAGEVRVVGNVVGEPPFRGTLQHRGWRAAKVSLPKIAEEHDVAVLAPAEVEL
ncbi:MAG: DUF2760 domain-containing protein [Myxococcota bacterium]